MVASDSFKIVCLSGYHLFVTFENAFWLLIDMINGKIVRKNTISEGVIDFKAFDGRKIVYVGGFRLKLQVFNPFTENFFKVSQDRCVY